MSSNICRRRRRQIAKAVDMKQAGLIKAPLIPRGRIGLVGAGTLACAHSVQLRSEPWAASREKVDLQRKICVWASVLPGPGATQCNDHVLAAIILSRDGAMPSMQQGRSRLAAPLPFHRLCSTSWCPDAGLAPSVFPGVPPALLPAWPSTTGRASRRHS